MASGAPGGGGGGTAPPPPLPPPSPPPPARGGRGGGGGEKIRGGGLAPLPAQKRRDVEVLGRGLVPLGPDLGGPAAPLAGCGRTPARGAVLPPPPPPPP